MRGEWIRVSEKPPEKYEVVLVSDGKQVGVAMYNSAGVFLIDSDVTCDFLGSEVTHWMPLPQPPDTVLQNAEISRISAAKSKILTKADFSKAVESGDEILTKVDFSETAESDKKGHSHEIAKSDKEETLGISFDLNLDFFEAGQSDGEL